MIQPPNRSEEPAGDALLTASEAGPEASRDAEGDSDDPAPERMAVGARIRGLASKVSRFAPPRLSRELRRSSTTVSFSIEHGFIKILATQGHEVVDYRMIPVAPRFFREGLVSSQQRVAALIQSAVEDIGAAKTSVTAAVPGFQTNLWVLALPGTGDMDPGVIIPQDARRRKGVSPETSLLTWRRLRDRLDRRRWLAVAATRRSIASVADTLAAAGLKVRRLELRPFAEARAVNQTEAIAVGVFAEGCDVVIIREGAPIDYAGLFWGAEAVDSTILANRLTEVVERAISSHDQNALDGPLSEETPLFVFGSPISRDREVANQLASELQRPLGRIAPPMHLPEEFPVEDMMVNVGLALAEA